MRAIRCFASSITYVNNSTRKHGLSVSRLFKLLDRRSNYVLTLVAFVLLIIPLPTPPGFSTVLALPAIFITAQLCVRNDKVFLPKCISEMRINKHIVRKLDLASKKYLSIVEKITRKRFRCLVDAKLKLFYNIILFALACSAAVPIPFVCMIPAFAGVLLSSGLIVSDGLLVVISFIVGCTGMSVIYLTIKTLFLFKQYLPL